MESKRPVAFAITVRRRKYFFLTERRSAEIIQEAFRLGASGHLVKSDAVELLPAIEAILQNRIFLSKSLQAAPPEIPDGGSERSDG